MGDTLSGRLHELRIEQLHCVAETIRDWPGSQERLDQAIRYLREAMRLCTVGTISQSEKLQVFSILAFAVPSPDTVQIPPDCGLQ
jgi:hypothetical protein